jgi:MFS family permease
MNLKIYWDVLKNLDFTKLWVSQVASQLTNYLLSFAILIKVFQITNSSVSVALIIMAFGAATVVFGSIAGVYADRFDRKWILTISNFAQAASVGLYFVLGDHLWGLVLITFLYSSLNQFYLPAEAPSIPNLVPKHQLLVANSYFAFTGSVALIVGFAMAGPLILAFGPASPYIVGMTLLIIAGLATLSLPSLNVRVESENPYSLTTVWGEFKEGLKHLWANQNLHFPLLSLLSIQVVNGMMITIAPAFIQHAIGINLDKGSLLVVAPLGVGILTGALVLGLEEKYLSKTKLVLLGFLGMGLMIVFLSFINFFIYKYAYYSIIGFLIGFFNSHIFAPSHSILQTFALAHLRGRVYGTLYVLLQIAATLPTIIVGVLADRVGLTYVMAALGVLLLILGSLIRPRNLSGQLEG